MLDRVAFHCLHVQLHIPLELTVLHVLPKPCVPQGAVSFPHLYPLEQPEPSPGTIGVGWHTSGGPQSGSFFPLSPAAAGPFALGVSAATPTGSVGSVACIALD